ncbi:MAG: hypothetical protein ACE5OS_15520 [Anaerolineae bacterium]
MSALSFPYIEGSSIIFGTVLRPLVSLEAYSELLGRWVLLENLLADTGADISVLPRPLGELLVDDITTGRYSPLSGLNPVAVLPAFIHTIQVRLGDEEFEMPVAIADTSLVPPLLGRKDALDRFVVRFVVGEETIIEGP